jgi:hypothetical protein
MHFGKGQKITFAGLNLPRFRGFFTYENNTLDHACCVDRNNASFTRPELKS